MRINIADITRDSRCQSRVEMHEDVVADYAEAMNDGATFPAITVFHDGQRYWLADGFHRVAAAELAGATSLDADIRQGGIRDAELHSVSANGTHGKQRTNADKRRAVEMLLKDAEWQKWSDREIARQCGVSQPFVGSVRQSLSDNGYQTEGPRLATRNGTTYEVDITNIGRQDGKAVVYADASTADLQSTLKRLVVRYGVDQVRHHANIVLGEVS